MDRGAWWATVPGIAKELDMTEQLTLSTFNDMEHLFICLVAIYMFSLTVVEFFFYFPFGFFSNLLVI